MEPNSKEPQLNGINIIRRKTAILGEVNTGKTALAAKLLQELKVTVNPEEITVIDFAPDKIGEVGGKIKDYVELDKKTRYLLPTRVYAPRLTGTSAEQIMRFAKLNAKNMGHLLDRFIKSKTRILVLNDVTLYFHFGELAKVMECVDLSETFLVTAYCGSKLAKDLGTGISGREKQMVEAMLKFMNLIVRI